MIDLPRTTDSVRWRRSLLAHALVLGALGFGRTLPAHDGLAELALERYGAQAAEAVRRWQSMIDAQRHVSELQQVGAVNEFFNRSVAFAEDEAVWGVPDYWATPLETLSLGQGDCEDYSIAKYVTLGLLGVPLERLRITYVRAETSGTPGGTQAHMVLAYYARPDAEPLVLDNLDVRILPASQRPDLRPVFGFNSEGLWMAGVQSPADPTARLSRWRDLLRRMQEQGLN